MVTEDKYCCQRPPSIRTLIADERTVVAARLIPACDNLLRVRRPDCPAYVRTIKVELQSKNQL